MIFTRNTCTIATALILVATFMLQLPNNAAKIAYKKPIYGKLYHMKAHGGYGGYFNKKHYVKATTTTTTSKPVTTTEASSEYMDYNLQLPSDISEKFIKKHDLQDYDEDAHLVKIVDENDKQLNENQLLNAKEAQHPHAEQPNAVVKKHEAVMELPPTSTTPLPTQLEINSTSRTPATPVVTTSTTEATTSTSLATPVAPRPTMQKVPCTCGVFLSSQIAGNGVPREEPVIKNDVERAFQCNPMGQKQCQTKCLEMIVQHLPNSASILCATLNRDCHKERAYLFIKNCRDEWINTTLTAGREYCCQNGQPYACPLV